MATTPRHIPLLSSLFSNLGGDEAVKKRLIENTTAKNLMGNKDYLAAIKGLGANPTEEALNGVRDKFVAGATPTAEAVEGMFNDPFAKGSGNAGAIAKAYMGAHPWKTAAGVGLGLTNLSGLTDNDYYGGQLAGLAAGGLGSAFLGNGFSPMVTMAGGALGSLFDKLRQKQAESKRASQYNNY